MELLVSLFRPRRHVHDQQVPRLEPEVQKLAATRHGRESPLDVGRPAVAVNVVFDRGQIGRLDADLEDRRDANRPRVGLWLAHGH